MVVHANRKQERVCSQTRYYLLHNGVASPKLGEDKYFDLERATVFDLGDRLPTRKTTRCTRNFRGQGPFTPWLHLCYCTKWLI